MILVAVMPKAADMHIDGVALLLWHVGRLPLIKAA
jgi:hypothetical protein